MPKKKKLKLDNLSITSFVTSEESIHVKAKGASLETNCIAETCIFQCTGPALSDDCGTGTCATNCGTCATCATNCGTCETCQLCYPSVGTNAYQMCFEPEC